ncbi:MAG: hypothetical protein FWH22_00255 [Fibromonadales bacterium]|nr:hypothetical protein [Fibromonadales bacterium]
MRSRIKLFIVTVAILLAGCSSDLPDTPKYEFCKFTIAEQTICESFRSSPDIKKLCDDYNGETVNSCEE